MDSPNIIRIGQRPYIFYLTLINMSNVNDCPTIRKSNHVTIVVNIDFEVMVPVPKGYICV